MNRIRTIIVELLIATGIATALLQSCAAAGPPSATGDRSSKDLVVIALRPNVQTDLRVIRLVDVANITGGDAATRERIKELDLDDGVAEGESLTILPPQIEFRLRLAKVDVEQVSIKGSGVRVTSGTGSASTRTGETVTGTSGRIDKPRRAVDFSAISVDDGPLEREIVQAAKDCVLAKLPWASDSVDIRLSQSIPTQIHDVSSAAGYECAAEIRTAGPPVGRVQVRVVANAPKKPTFDVVVILDVRHFDQLVMVTRGIDRGHVLTTSDLYVDRQDVTELTDYCPTIKELVGTTTRRSIRALQPVRMSDVETTTRLEGAILIKRRDQVKMVARVGSLSVTAVGEAIQEGRLGEIIRVRNIDSNTTIQGRVLSPGEVEISF